MKRKNNKGFTLIELIAVVVVLIIILLLAINKIRESSRNTKNNALKASALSYIKAIDEQAGLDVLGSNFLKQGIYNKYSIDAADVKLSGKKPDEAIVCINDYKVVNACLEYSSTKINYVNGKVTSINKGSCGDPYEFECPGGRSFEFSYTGNYATFTPPENSTYFIQLWGAQGGGNDASPGGKGAYTSGKIDLTTSDTLYIYVGEKGMANASTTNVGSYNGGGYSGNDGGSQSYGGGGATDVRLVSGSWNDAVGLRSRIMVAAGGGGNVAVSSRYSIVPGVGGKLIGGNAVGTYDGNKPDGATQTGSGTVGANNKKGIFGAGVQSNVSGWGGGGGGGFWGGSMGHGHGGSGGSSYISGYIGCVAVQSSSSNTSKSGCANGTSDINCSIHYSGLAFTDSVMIAGNESMPNYSGTGNMTGNEGNGYARISINSYHIGSPSQNGNNNFDFTGTRQIYTAEKSGNYKLETWGAQGGNAGEYLGGYGAYSVGTINLNKNDKLYINVGGAGQSDCVTNDCSGGYNGGGTGQRFTGDQMNHVAGGGGATSIAGTSGLLNTLNVSNIYIVAGAGGGAYYHTNGAGYSNNGASGGGYIGNSGSICSYTSSVGQGGSQSAGGAAGYRGGAGSFGIGGTISNGSSGGGGGYYGGGSAAHAGSGGGSGYIGNPLLSNKVMYCYNCQESSDVNTKTVSTTCASETPTENCAKKGNGYVRITFIE